MEREEFGRLLTVLRMKKGMSQKELADKLQISTSAVSKWENGKNFPDMPMFSKIAEVFGVSCDSLLKPEKTLQRLEHPELGTEEKEMEEDKGKEKRKNSPRRKALGIATVIAAVLVLAVGTLSFYNIYKEPTAQQVGIRYIAESEYGEVYEIAVVVDGEIDEEFANDYLDKVHNSLKQGEKLEADIVKISYYDNEKDALKWEETRNFSYLFLDVE